MLYPQNLVRGALFIGLSELMFVGMGALVKTASDTAPNEMIVFFRNVFGLLVLLPFVLRAGVRPLLATRVPHLHLLRGLVGLASMYCFFYSLGKLALADATLLKLTAPLFIPLVAVLWLHEYLSSAIRVAVIIGFIGVALVLQPGGGWHPAALVGLAGGALAAVSKTSVRRLSSTEPAGRIVFYFALTGALVSAVPLLWAWQTPTADEWGLFAALGIFATAGQMLLTRGYAAAPATQVGPFTYTSVIFAVILGWLFWGETLSLVTWVGAGAIVTAGILILRGNRLRASKVLEPE